MRDSEVRMLEQYLAGAEALAKGDSPQTIARKLGLRDGEDASFMLVRHHPLEVYLKAIKDGIEDGVTRYYLMAWRRQDLAKAQQLSQALQKDWGFVELLNFQSHHEEREEKAGLPPNKGVVILNRVLVSKPH